MKKIIPLLTILISSVFTPAFANEEIEARVSNGVTYVGKWGGQIHASVELISGSTLRACYGDQPCFEGVPYEISDGAVVVENSPHKWIYKPVSDGFDASYFKDGKKLSEALLR